MSHLGAQKLIDFYADIKIFSNSYQYQTTPTDVDIWGCGITTLQFICIVVSCMMRYVVSSQQPLKALMLQCVVMTSSNVVETSKVLLLFNT